MALSFRDLLERLSELSESSYTDIYGLVVGRIDTGWPKEELAGAEPHGPPGWKGRGRA